MPLSTPPLKKRPAALSGRRVLAWAILGASLLLTLLAWRYAEQRFVDFAGERFKVRTERNAELILARMHGIELMLKGGAALFASSRVVDRDEWRAYVQSLGLDDYYPGVQGVGFAALLNRADKPAHEATVRAEGFTEYTIHPPGDREVYSSIVFLEHFSGRNLRAFGYDMYADPVRREAMERARDTGKPAVSGKVRLVQESDTGVQPGFLMYVPVYRPGMPLDTVDKRRAALAGFVFSPFRAGDLMSDIYETPRRDMELQLYDAAVGAENLLFISDAGLQGSHHMMDRTITIGGRTWVARFQSTPDFEASPDRGQSWIILSGGILLDLLLFWVLYRSALYHETMDHAAASLKQSRDSYRTLMENVPGAVFRSAPAYPRRVEHISCGIESLAGTTCERFLSGDVSLGELIHSEDRRVVEQAIAEAMRQREAYSVEYRLLSGNGDVKWARELGRASFDAAGKAKWLDGVILDITEQKSVESQLRDLSSYARNLIEASLDPLLTIGADGRVMDVNTAAVNATGRPRDELIGSRFTDYFTEPDKAGFAYRSVFSQGSVTDYPLALCHVTGRITEVLLNASVYRNAVGEVAGVFAAARDITRLKRSQEELEDTNREILILSQMVDLLQGCQSAEEAFPIVQSTLSRLFPGSSGACYVLNDSGTVYLQATHWGNLPPPDTAFAPDECWAPRLGHLHAVGFGHDINPRCGHLAGETAPSLCVPLLAQGKVQGVIQISLASVPEQDSQAEHVVNLALNASESISLALANLRLRESLRELSFHDPLTGLFNRRFMDEALARELSRVGRIGQPMAVAMIDVDKFKNFNDMHGHHAGDMALRRVAEQMLHFREGMDVACRFGGEEFTLILPEITLEAARDRFEQLRQSIESAQLQFNGRALPPVTVSIGVAMYPEHGTAAAELLRAADMALYRAKREGRNRVTFAGWTSQPEPGG